jgi:hypothetical protein
MMTMYDSTTIEQIPDDASVVAGYVNGSPATFRPLCQKFPNARHVSIAVTAEADADFLDVEKGNARMDQVTGWYRRQKERGVARPGIYASVDPIRDELLPILKAAGITRSSVRLWAAHFTNREHVCGPRPNGCGEILIQVDGTQFTETAHGRNLDQSLLTDNFFDQPKPTLVFTAQDQASLAGLAQNTLHNAVSTILRLTAEHSPGAVFTERMADYLNGVFAADKEKVPEGITVYHPAGNGAEPFHSHGTQTLQGLALAFGCQPSAVVRVTAEQSPGAVFGAGMAQYLDDVFGRSTTPVPEGIHLYYQK